MCYIFSEEEGQSYNFNGCSSIKLIWRSLGLSPQGISDHILTFCTTLGEDSLTLIISLLMEHMSCKSTHGGSFISKKSQIVAFAYAAPDSTTHLQVLLRGGCIPSEHKEVQIAMNRSLSIVLQKNWKWFDVDMIKVTQTESKIWLDLCSQSGFVKHSVLYGVSQLQVYTEVHAIQCPRTPRGAVQKNKQKFSFYSISRFWIWKSWECIKLMLISGVSNISGIRLQAN